jgi:CheY-like chemotaxis protein
MPTEAHLTPLQILLVDDDELFLKAITMLLKMVGHAPTPAVCGEDALAILGRGLKPDLVILDLDMPGMGGKQALPRIRMLHPHVPILVATGFPDQEAMALVSNTPLVSLIRKPFSLGELQEHLKIIYLKPLVHYLAPDHDVFLPSSFRQVPGSLTARYR